MLSDELTCILTFLCWPIPFILAVLALWLPRKFALRGFESSIDMDGSIFLQASDGRIDIRKRNIGIWLAILVFGLILIVPIFGLISTIVDAFQGQPIRDLELFALTLVIIAAIAGMGFRAYRSLRRTSYSFDIETKTLKVTKKGELKSIPFMEIECVYLESDLESRALRRIAVGLVSGEKIELGSVSGTGAGGRGEKIACAIADTISVKVESRPSDSW
ncbi:MAG: hypothetical protein GTO18_12655 [Anaerolineales bacterium]|nr:hypothetical protein [Anaerolineales bacterium]